MQFPATERMVFASNPLAEVICQIKFPRQFSVESSLPVELQKYLSGSFPIAESRFNVEVALLDAAQQPRPSLQQVYDFSSRERDQTVSLAADFVALTCRKYVEWSAFSALIRSTWDAVRMIYGVNLITRLGLRYRNIINRDELGLSETPWNQLVKPELIGLLASDLPGSSLAIEANASHLFTIAPGMLRLNSGIVRSADGTKQALLIDSDFYVEDTIDGVNDVYIDILNSYNVEAGRLFRWAVHDRLRERLLSPEHPAD